MQRAVTVVTSARLKRPVARTIRPACLAGPDMCSVEEVVTVSTLSLFDTWSA